MHLTHALGRKVQTLPSPVHWFELSTRLGNYNTPYSACPSRNCWKIIVEPLFYSAQTPVNLLGSNIRCPLKANIMCTPDGLYIHFPKELSNRKMPALATVYSSGFNDDVHQTHKVYETCWDELIKRHLRLKKCYQHRATKSSICRCTSKKVFFLAKPVPAIISAQNALMQVPDSAWSKQKMWDLLNLLSQHILY